MAAAVSAAVAVAVDVVAVAVPVNHVATLFGCYQWRKSCI